MSEGVDLRVSRSLEILAALKETGAKFARREDQLVRDIKTRRFHSTKTSEDSTAGTQSSYAAHIAGLEERFHAEQERLKAVHQARRVRISRIQTRTLRNLPDLARETKRRWMGEFQMRNHVAQQKLAADTAAVDADYASATAEWQANEQVFRALERRARGSFRGYWTLRRMLRPKDDEALSAAASGDPSHEFQGNLALAESQLTEFRRLPLPRFFSIATLPLWFLLSVAGGAALAWHLGLNTTSYAIAGGAAAAVFAVICVVHHLGLNQGRPTGTALAGALARARGIIAASGSRLTTTHGRERQRVQAEYEHTCAEIQRVWDETGDVERNYETKVRKKMDAQVPRLYAKIEHTFLPKLQRLQSDHATEIERLRHEEATLLQQITDTHAAETSALADEEKIRWHELEAGWKAEIGPLYDTIHATNAEAGARFPAWETVRAAGWTPAVEFTPVAKFGHLDLDLSRRPAALLPRDPRLALPGSPQVTVPLALAFPGRGSLLFETEESGAAAVNGALNNIVLRLLATTPPGKLSFTIIDPVGLGQSFAGLMHLTDYEESLVNRRIWTQRDQVEERLAELSEHVEKVIQMYLRDEYATITEYNEKAGSVAEKYHFLVVADFPANFSEIAVKRLQSLAVSGPRCGIFTLIHWDRRQPPPEGFVPDELRKNSICLRGAGNDFILGKQQVELGATLVLDPPPPADLAVELMHKIGQSSIDSNRVEVPFSQIAPAPGEMWTNETTNELRVAIGRTGATKFQYLAMGKGTRQHALFAGKTGSGKSTLFHVIITNLALACSPAQVEFYLIDFKKGVEFKCYASKYLPHAKVVAIESDREFALSVLQRLDAELKRRGDMFRKLGVQDVAGYKRAGGTEPMPRALLLIDEFQEFFVEDDPIAQTASLLLDRIVRQGRAFGLHVLLGSQTLGGAYSLARATLGQMVIRVALQCNEADSYLIMDENNSAPRLLSRPGEGIYNDAAGAMEGNSPFQVVWLSDEERDAWLDKVTVLAKQQLGPYYPGPVVFEGNAPAAIRENDLLRAALDASPSVAPSAARCWLGAPNSIKGPTEAVFQRQSGNHMLVVGQREEASLVMLGLSLLALSAQYPVGAVKFALFDNSAPGSLEANFLGQIVKAIPQEVVCVSGQDVGAAVNELATELKARIAGEAGPGVPPAVFLFIHGLHKFKKLRHEDDFSFSVSDDAAASPGAQFNEIITEGAAYGIHIITTIDTLSSVNRFMNRKALSEFEKRVIFQMSANDSASLIDSPKGSNLGLHRALYYNEHEGYLETFRPYAFPEADWFHDAIQKLAQRRAPHAGDSPGIPTGKHEGHETELKTDGV